MHLLFVLCVIHSLRPGVQVEYNNFLNQLLTVICLYHPLSYSINYHIFMVAGIMALCATSSYYDSTEIAARILPNVVVLTIDPDRLTILLKDILVLLYFPWCMCNQCSPPPVFGFIFNIFEILSYLLSCVFFTARFVELSLTILRCKCSF